MIRIVIRIPITRSPDHRISRYRPCLRVSVVGFAYYE